ncbi:hypothetical protein Pla110_24700 [Polystyrenella longa]|uniref:Uncharacterized protein n=1 Tax=Polystyrenella longa TaxID=2528007 RepID=A0A518CND7_9PLAN|nr:hypothetical protein [Polystyrenella longa]QDU80737.1 hypothetical protein Pla110_24700 [Polystyrenella longa]
MSHQKQDNDLDLVVGTFRRYFQKMCVLGVVALLLLIASIVVGLPHIQTTYTYSGPKPKGSAPTTEQKLDAWYFSLTGWQHVESGQYGNQGCPPILFIPLWDCLD